MALYQWDNIPKEQVNPTFARQVIHGEHLTVAKVYLSAGAIVPRHSHHQEQITMLEQGLLRFIFDHGEQLLTAGQMLRIAPNAPHQVEAVEESVATDLFSPARDDWQRGDDAYLRR